MQNITIEEIVRRGKQAEQQIDCIALRKLETLLFVKMFDEEYYSNDGIYNEATRMMYSDDLDEFDESYGIIIKFLMKYRPPVNRLISYLASLKDRNKNLRDQILAFDFEKYYDRESIFQNLSKSEDPPFSHFEDKDVEEGLFTATIDERKVVISRDTFVNTEDEIIPIENFRAKYTVKPKFVPYFNQVLEYASEGRNYYPIDDTRKFIIVYKIDIQNIIKEGKQDEDNNDIENLKVSQQKYIDYLLESGSFTNDEVFNSFLFYFYTENYIDGETLIVEFLKKYKFAELLVEDKFIEKFENGKELAIFDFERHYPNRISLFQEPIKFQGNFKWDRNLMYSKTFNKIWLDVFKEIPFIAHDESHPILNNIMYLSDVAFQSVTLRTVLDENDEFDRITAIIIGNNWSIGDQKYIPHFNYVFHMSNIFSRTNYNLKGYKKEIVLKWPFE